MKTAAELRNQLLKQVRLLERLGNHPSTNPHEARAALAKAQEIKRIIEATPQEVEESGELRFEDLDPQAGTRERVDLNGRWEYGAKIRIGRTNGRWGNTMQADLDRWLHYIAMGVTPNEDGWIQIGGLYIGMDKMANMLLKEAEQVMKDYCWWLEETRAILRPALPAPRGDFSTPDRYSITEWQPCGDADILPYEDALEVSQAKLRAIQNEIAKRSRKPLPHARPCDKLAALQYGTAALPPS